MLLLKMLEYRVRMNVSPTTLKLVVLYTTLAFAWGVMFLNLLGIYPEGLFLKYVANTARPNSILLDQIYLKTNSGKEIRCYIP